MLFTQVSVYIYLDIVRKQFFRAQVRAPSSYARTDRGEENSLKLKEETTRWNRNKKNLKKPSHPSMADI